jgi:hypothetical protein
VTSAAAVGRIVRRSLPSRDAYLLAPNDLGPDRRIAATRRTGEGQDSAGQTAVGLTDLLTRRCGTGETERRTGDGGLPSALVSETNEHVRDVEDVRRMSHNPAMTGRPAGCLAGPGEYFLYGLQGRAERAGPQTGRHS